MRLVVPAGVLAAALSAQPLFGDSVVLAPARDNTLYEVTNRIASNGAGDNIFAGVTAVGERRRAVILFDVAGAIPPNSVVTGAALTLHLSKTAASPTVIDLHRVLENWGESTSDASEDEGGGAVPAPGDVTWSHTFFDTEFWTTPGGVFDPVASASRSVDSPPPAAFAWGPTAAMTSDVQRWLDEPTANFGWLLKGDESAVGNAKRFDSREDPNPALRPMLLVEFHSPADSVPPIVPPAAIELEPGSPNPFGITTAIGYTLPEESRATLTIQDASGRRVATLVEGVRPKGRNTIIWDGSEASGNPAAAGVYLVRLESGGQTRFAKVHLIR